MLFSPQIPLQLEPRRSDRFEDFVAGPNDAALGVVRELLDEPGGSVWLTGPDGSGKSHLLNACCHEARSRGMAAFYIALRHLPPEASASLAGMRGLGLVCIDDIDAIAGDRQWEEALFHCFNEVRAANGRLLIGSSAPLSALEFSLPDLASRMAWGVRLTLAPPTDSDRLAILRSRARSLQIEVSDDVFAYLLKYGRRDTGSLLGHLERMKEVAFAAKRRITVPLARDVLQHQQKGESHAE